MDSRKRTRLTSSPADNAHYFKAQRKKLQAKQARNAIEAVDKAGLGEVASAALKELIQSGDLETHVQSA